MSSITSANSVLLLGVNGLFAVPQQLQGFATDDMYSMDMVESAEVQMGADGKMASGWVPQIKNMNVTLLANSKSNDFFEAWYSAQEAAREVYTAFGTVVQPGVGKAYILSNGVLTNYTPLAEGKKVLQPRKFQIKWESALGAPI
jgi:hypothetical protein